MNLLDTDHTTLLRMPPSERRARLEANIAVATEPVVIPVIVVEEVLRGWLAAIAKERTAIRQVFAYRELARLFDFFADYVIAEFDDAAAKQFDVLKSLKVRISTRDLKIAATALALSGRVITANRRDFEKVPGLPIENWLD